MKKHLRFAFVMVLALMLTGNMLTVSASASSTTLRGSGSAVVDIEVEYHAATDNRSEIEAGADGTRVYRVTLEWNPSGRIVYNAGTTTYCWNGDDLKYASEVTDKGWTVDDAKLTFTVKNRSNRPVEVNCADPVTISEVTMTGSYDRQTFELPSAATGGFDGVGTEQVGTAVYTVGTVNGDISSSTTNIASITLTVTGK